MSNVEGLFPVLNTAKVKRQNEAGRILPSWLANPTQFSGSNLSEHSQPIDDFSEFLDPELIKYIKNVMGIDNLFPVQKCLIPSLTLQFRSRMFRRPNDICVSSPTGSGKTLAFAIPIVSYLKQSLSRSLRALIILPSRDLAKQVYKTFHELCIPTHLRCAVVGLETEKAAINSNNPLSIKLPKHEQLIDDIQSKDLNSSILSTSQDDTDQEYTSNVNILISTPGVLMDLIHNSPGFTLRDLEILVIDEADRLMADHKHDTLSSIERATFKGIQDCPCKASSNETDSYNYSKNQRVCFSSITGCAIHNSRLSKPIHKLLFSATLSSDPQLLIEMNLFQPRLFLASKSSIANTKIRHSLDSNTSTPCSSPIGSQPIKVSLRDELPVSCSAIPEQLEEKMFVTEPKEKLFILWYLFHELGLRKTLCFCNQLPNCKKICIFLNQIHGIRAAEFSSSLGQEHRKKLLDEFAHGKLDVLVCTDLMERGMDVAGVEYVLSFDMPSSGNNYVHRVGRTARAGNKGTAITLVETKELKLFGPIVRGAHKKPHSMQLKDVIEEIKVPFAIKKSAEKYEMYTKTLDDYEDKLRTKKIKY